MQTTTSHLGEFPSGQRGQTVNLLRFASMVRIRPPPPEKVKHQMVLDFFCGWSRIRRTNSQHACGLLPPPVQYDSPRAAFCGCSLAQRLRALETGGYLAMYPRGTSATNPSSTVPSLPRTSCTHLPFLLQSSQERRCSHEYYGNSIFRRRMLLVYHPLLP